MNKTFKIHTNDSVKVVPLNNALDELIKGNCFTMFLEFIDPRIDTLVQGNFTFYPKTQVTNRGRCFLAEHVGLSLKIPSDLSWWSENQNIKQWVKIVQDTVILVKGEYKAVQFELTSSTSFKQLA